MMGKNTLIQWFRIRIEKRQRQMSSNQSIMSVVVILALSKFPSPFLYLLWEKYKDLVSLGFLILCPLLTAWN